MDSRILLRRLLHTPSVYRALITSAIRSQSRHFTPLAPSLSHARFISLPRVIQPSFWASVVPRFGRTRTPASSPTASSQEWNPATPYIILSLLVGSQAIQVLWLKRDRAHDMRRAEAKMGVLREVIEKVQNGEDVDVEKLLGTGVEGEEKEWAEVMKEIEEEEILFQSRKKRQTARQAAAETHIGAQTTEDQVVENTKSGMNDAAVKVETYNGAKFY